MSAVSTRVKQFARKHVHSVHAKFAGSPLLGCRAEAIKPRGDTNDFQTDLRQTSNQLCLRQSAGDSTGPQIDVAAGVLGEFHVNRYIGQVQAATN